MTTALSTSVSIRTLIPYLFAGCLLAGSSMVLHPGYGDKSSPTQGIPSSTINKQAKGEALLPDMLELELDATDQSLVHLRVLQEIDGRARLVIDSEAPVQWMTPQPQGLMSIERKGLPQDFTLNVAAAKQMKTASLKAELIFEDENGQAFMHVSRELDLKGPKVTPVLSRSLPEGLSSDGKSIRSYTPLDAPVPTTQGGAQ